MFFLRNTCIDLYPEIVLRSQRRKLKRTKQGQEGGLKGPERDGAFWGSKSSWILLILSLPQVNEVNNRNNKKDWLIQAIVYYGLHWGKKKAITENKQCNNLGKHLGLKMCILKMWFPNSFRETVFLTLPINVSGKPKNVIRYSYYFWARKPMGEMDFYLCCQKAECLCVCVCVYTATKQICF